MGQNRRDLPVHSLRGIGNLTLPPRHASAILTISLLSVTSSLIKNGSRCMLDVLSKLAARFQCRFPIDVSHWRLSTTPYSPPTRSVGEFFFSLNLLQFFRLQHSGTSLHLLSLFGFIEVVSVFLPEIIQQPFTSSSIERQGCKNLHALQDVVNISKLCTRTSRLYWDERCIMTST